MAHADWTLARRLLEASGASIAPGLTERELRDVETMHGFRFPQDLRSLLSCFQPVGPHFPDWRTPGSPEILNSLRWPFEGMAFDIENNSFWWDVWGAKPELLSDALAVARAAVDAAPRLIPIYGHRYIPSPPEEAGNPIFSVHQTDIIYYGVDLRAYLRCEFGGVEWADAVRGTPRVIPFWTDLLEPNG